MRVTLVVLASAVAAAPAAAFAAPQPVVVFMQRHGQTVTARRGSEVKIPRFGGGDRAWTQLVACVKDRFAPFQVEISDQRPAAGDYITALVGGRSSMIGLSDRTTDGIGPYSGEVIPNAIVHIFSQVTGERDVDNLCAVAAHEVGHSLGLDHSHLCGDIMSYYNDQCGTQQFIDADAPCGESEDRECANGDATQNSYRRLVSLVGLRPGAPRTGPKPPGAAPANDNSDDSDNSADPSDDAADDSYGGGDDAASDDAADDTTADDSETTTAPQAPDTSADTSNTFSDDSVDNTDDSDDTENTSPAPVDPSESADDADGAGEQPAQRTPRGTNGRRWRDRGNGRSRCGE